MLAKLFSGAVRDLLGRETLKSEVYGYNLPNAAGYDAVAGRFHLEATPHLFDKTKYALSEVVITHTASRLTPSDLKKFIETSATTKRTSVKDDNGKAYALTRDGALEKIAEFEARMDRFCVSPEGRCLSYRKISSGDKPDAPAAKAGSSVPVL